MPSRGKSRALVALYIVLPGFLTLLALNLAMAPSLTRLVEGGGFLSDDFLPSPDAELAYTLIPRLNLPRHSYWGVPIITNEQGFRTRPFTTKGPAPRVLLLGDSIAFGVFLPARDTLAASIESTLRARGMSVQVFNLGIPTYNMRQKRASHALFGKGLEPDLVLLQVKKAGDFQKIPPLALTPWMRRVPLWMWIRLRLYRAADRSGSREAGIAAYRSLESDCRRDNVPLCVIAFPYLRKEGEGPLWEADRRIYAASGTKVFDVERILGARGEPASFRVRPGDIIHPNGKAHTLVAKALGPWMESALE